MAVRLLVTKSASPSLPDAYVFEQDRISIGRDSSSHLILPDPKRVVSKQHAEIVCRDGIYQLLDLGSKNFTYLNEERVQPGHTYDLKRGDSLRIGEYELTFEPVVEEVVDYDRTVFDASFVNPFEEDAAQLVRALAGIQAKYEQEAPGRRADALREALEQAGAVDGGHEANVLISRFLGGPDSALQDTPAKGGAAEKAVPPAKAAADAEALAWSDGFVIDRDEHTPAWPEPAPARLEGKAVRLEEDEGHVADALIRVLVKVIGIPWQFRHEFIGQTIAQSPESPMYYSGNPDALKTYLLDASLPDEERERRLALVERWVEELVLHQLALLDGYKASVLQGVERLLQELDPEATEASIRQEGAQYGMIPLLRKAQVAVRLLEKKRELQGEDWSYAERTVFRPAFIKSYLARMTAQRR